jgi:glutamate/tyrosine decarboxylase-like PLP-dependent enzyme
MWTVDDRYKRLFLDPKGGNYDAFPEEINKCINSLKSWWTDPHIIPEKEDRIVKTRMPAVGEEISQLCEEFTERLTKCRKVNNRYFSSIVPSPCTYSLIASLLMGIFNPNNAGMVEREGGERRPVFKYDVAPNLEEECIMMLAADVIGYKDPEKAGGNIVSCGTVAILTALTVARDKKYPLKFKKNGLFDQQKGVVIASKAAHFAVKKSMRLLGLGEENLIEVPVSTPEELKEFCENGKPLPLKPKREDYERALKKYNGRVIAVISTVGTTCSETIEPINYLLELREEHGFYLIVDAAHGGFAHLLSGEWEGVKEKMEGIEEADAVVLDPHKWGYVQYPCGAVVFKNWEDLKNSSLYFEPSEWSEYRPAPTLEGSRPGGPVAAAWIALKALGKEGYKQIIGNCLALTKYLEERLREEGHRPVHEVDLNVVNFDVNSGAKTREDQNRLNYEVYKKINERGNFRVGFTKDLAGLRVREREKDLPIETIKVAIMSPYTTKEDVDEFIKELKEVNYGN